MIRMKRGAGMVPEHKKNGEPKNLSLWQAYLLNLDDDTREVYMRALRMFCRVNGFRSLEEAAERADEQAFVEFIRALRDRSRSPNTIRLYATAVRRFYEATKRPLGQLETRLVIPKRRVMRETNAIDRELAREIVLTAPPRKRALFHLLWGTGLRIGEALALRKKDVDLASDPPRIRVITEKTNKSRVVFLPRDLAMRLRNHITDLNDDDYVFHVEGNPRRPLNPDKVGELFRRILFKLDKLKRDSSGRGYVYSLHSFRRSYETVLATSGVHPMAIKLLLGHSQGVEDSYLRLSVNDLVAEWRKAEPNLRLDARSDVRSTVDGAVMRQLARSQLMTLRFIENQLSYLFGKREGQETGSTKAELDDIKHHLEQIQRQIRGLEELLSRSGIAKINRRATGADIDWSAENDDEEGDLWRYVD